MCAQFFYQREASAKLSPNLIRAPLVDDKCPEPLGNERTSAWLWSVCCWAPRQPPWFPSGLAPCLSFPPFVYTRLAPKYRPQHIWALQKHSALVPIPGTPICYDQKVDFGVENLDFSLDSALETALSSTFPTGKGLSDWSFRSSE